MALILNIETATTNCSVSLSEDGETLVLKENRSLSYSHAELLHVYIDSLFKQAEITPKQLDAIAVSKGPGSYTGLRIGVSSAKGLCYALNKPLIAIDTLEILARQVRIDRGTVVPMIDARRMEVYSAVFSHNLNLIRDIRAEVLSTESFKEYLNLGKTCFIGNGVEKAMDLLKHQNADFVPEVLPSSREMGIISEAKYKKSDMEDVAYFEPYYLKDFMGAKKL